LLSGKRTTTTTTTPFPETITNSPNTEKPVLQPVNPASTTKKPVKITKTTTNTPTTSTEPEDEKINET